MKPILFVLVAVSLVGQSDPEQSTVPKHTIPKHAPRHALVSPAPDPAPVPIQPPHQLPPGLHAPRMLTSFLARHKILEPVADIGGWIDRRRAFFVNSTIANPFWWHSLTLTSIIAVLLWILYVLQASESRKLWNAAAALADIWNWAVYAENRAEAAIAEYNRHMETCTRLAEIEASGKPLPSEQAEAATELTKARAELELITKEMQQLKAQLANRESEIAQFNARIAELSAQVSPKDEGSPTMLAGRLNAELTVRINSLTMENEELTRQLDKQRKSKESKTAIPRGWPEAAGNSEGGSAR